MRAICVEDEPLTLEYTAELCRKLNPPVPVECFTGAKAALEWIQDHPVDLALLDINLPDMNGIALAARIKERWPDANILFLTAYREFAFDAFAVHPSGYLLKPVTLDALQREIDYTRAAHPCMGAAHIQAVTFGNFELLVDGVPVVFKRSKAKELLAYLIDRQGTSVTRAEISAVLFENELYDHSRQKYLDVIITIAGGKPVITQNTVLGKPNNIFIHTGKLIDITGYMRTGALIDVTLQSNEGQVTRGAYTNGNELNYKRNYLGASMAMNIGPANFARAREKRKSGCLERSRTTSPISPSSSRRRPQIPSRPTR